MRQVNEKQTTLLNSESSPASCGAETMELSEIELRAACTRGIPIERLEKICNDERARKTPLCNIGDTVWDKNADPYKIISIEIFSRMTNIHTVSPDGEKKSFSIGKRSVGRTVFFTYEAAVNAYRKTSSDNEAEKEC